MLGSAPSQKAMMRLAAKLCPSEAMMKTIEEKRTLSKWFAHSANWFVLFVQTYEEQRIAERLQPYLDSKKYVVFVPTKDYAHRSKNGGVITRKVPWLAGYVFIAATVDERECLGTLKPLIFNDSSIYKLLTNGGGTDSIKLSEHDKTIMTTILDENFNIPALEAVVVGDKVQIIDGAILGGMGGRVKRVNKRRRTVMLEIDMFGTVKHFFSFNL